MDVSETTQSLTIVRFELKSPEFTLHTSRHKIRYIDVSSLDDQAIFHNNTV